MTLICRRQASDERRRRAWPVAAVMTANSRDTRKVLSRATCALRREYRGALWSGRGGLRLAVVPRRLLRGCSAAVEDAGE
jgi:hypothetical protein